ncbi:uncharacterized protein C8A04DRAFT_28646 [Dichotomopilus funicola]|uniref:Uncharacterized protein n=1 Tax=Dichotomopilus funicola TaxID=1934379 RepID=A0AAN6V2Q3_9PEZI|nr:hypothetical protein C8A04DRAFT_28646 [Dichotomopilus funicola]
MNQATPLTRDQAADWPPPAVDGSKYVVESPSKLGGDGQCEEGRVVRSPKGLLGGASEAGTDEHHGRRAMAPGTPARREEPPLLRLLRAVTSKRQLSCCMQKDERVVGRNANLANMVDKQLKNKSRHALSCLFPNHDQGARRKNAKPATKGQVAHGGVEDGPTPGAYGQYKKLRDEHPEPGEAHKRTVTPQMFVYRAGGGLIAEFQGGTPFRASDNATNFDKASYPNAEISH